MDDKKQAADIADINEDAAPAKTELELSQDEALKWKTDFLYLKAEFENYLRQRLGCV